MNCHRARQLISPYLDQQLTGREMLALQKHFGECQSCEAERRSIQQVKLLLRSLHEPRPHHDLAGAISLRLSEAEQPVWRVLSVSTLSAWPPRPQRGRRLATALALSCLTVLSFAATCFAPASRDGALTSAGFFLPLGLVPAHAVGGDETGLIESGPLLLSAAPHGDFLGLGTADGLRRERLFNGQYKEVIQPVLRLSPLPDETAPAYPQVNTSFAAYRTR